jgi:hypothetical protein
VNFKCKIQYFKQNKKKSSLGGVHAELFRINSTYFKVMKHVGIAIKEGKEVIFDYQDNWITIEIND